MGQDVSRRRVVAGSVAAAMAAMGRWPLAALGFAEEDGEAIPFLDAGLLKPKRESIDWNELKSWLTPTEQVYYVSHYGTPKLSAEEYVLKIGGLVARPRTLKLEEIKAMPRKEIVTTLECGGNGMGPQFAGAIANAKWAGTPLAPILRECGISEEAVEVAFWGADKGKEKIRNNDVTQNFARALSVKNALREDLLLCYELNGHPLAVGHGFPVRLVVPGWFGVAWVKWLTEIEVRDRALMTRFMAKDYVTLRGEEREGGDVVWKETSVGPINVKSMTARAVRKKDGTILISGAAWTDGTPIRKVEVKIDDGAWQEAGLEERPVKGMPHTWQFWNYQWKEPAAGEHTIVSRATDEMGRVQPSSEDAAIRLKKTYWEANQQWPRKIKV